MGKEEVTIEQALNEHRKQLNELTVRVNTMNDFLKLMFGADGPGGIVRETVADLGKRVEAIELLLSKHGNGPAN